MFSPEGHELERGWPGRIGGDRVVQLAAQTLQSFFTGGGGAREHAVYQLAEVELRTPVLHPPGIRIFGDGLDFEFANATAVVGPGDEVRRPEGAAELHADLAYAVVIGAAGAVAGTTAAIVWRAPGLPGVKSHDFALTVGPVVITPDELDTSDWRERVAHAARNTRLLPGELLIAPTGTGPAVERGYFEAALDGIGTLANTVV
jgi:hypothetical protein